MYRYDQPGTRLPRSRKHAALRWGMIAGGGTLAAVGISRRSKLGTALAAGGGLLALGGTRVSSCPRELHAQSSFTVNASPEEAYRFWSNFENLPRFMNHLDSVRVLDDRRSEWIARGPMEMRVKWTAEITERRDNEWIVWRSEPDALIPNRGSVQFRKAPGNRGTEVIVAMQYAPPAGRVGKAFAMMFGKDPSQVLYEDLRHFKQLMEAGEIPTTIGQPHGRRSALVKMAHAVYQESRPKPVRAERPEYAREVKVS